MNREIYYPSEGLTDAALLLPERETMLSLGTIIQSVLGTQTLLSGFPCTPTMSPSLTVNVGAGLIFAQLVIDATDYGTLPADNTNTTLKSAYQLSSTVNPFTFVPPVTSGQSRNDLIQITLVEVDNTSADISEWGGTTATTVDTPTGTTVIPVPNNPITQNVDTQRLDTVVISVKTGTPATTGTQVTPTPDANYVGAWVITTTEGVSTINTGNITRYAAPGLIGDQSTSFILQTLTQKISQPALYYTGIVNGGMTIAQRQPFDLTGMTLGIGNVDAMMGQVVATTVTDGSLTQATNVSVGLTKNSLAFESLTTTGTGTLTYITRIEANDAENYLNAVASYSCPTLHDISSSVNYTIEISKATARNDFSSVTVIATSGTIAVATSTVTLLSFENIAMGDCSNGIQIKVTAAIPALTTNNVYFNSAQLNTGLSIIPFIPQDETTARLRCMRRYVKSYDDSVAVGTASYYSNNSGANATSTVAESYTANAFFPVTMIKAPIITIYSPNTGSVGFIGNDEGPSFDIAAAVGEAPGTKAFTVQNTATILDAVAYGFQYQAVADL